MAKALPTQQDLGPLPQIAGTRPIGRPDASAIGAGVAKLGQGIAQLGAGVADLAYDKMRFELATADSDFLTKKINLDDEFAHDTDYTTAEDRYTKKLTKIQQDSASLIKNPEMRERFVVSTNPKVASGAKTISGQAFTREASAQNAYIDEQGDKFIDQAMKAPDDATRSDIIQTHGRLIRGAVAAGFMSPETGYQKQRQWAQRYAEADINRRIDADPQGVINDLRPAPGGPEGIDNRIIKIESGGNPNAGASTSSAVGLGQFTEQTWLGQLKKHGAEVGLGEIADEIKYDGKKYYISDAGLQQQVLDLRRDPGVSKQMLAGLREDNSADLKQAGFEPTAGNIYLAHFLGASDAKKVLSADPSTPVSQILSPQVIAANRSILQGRTAGSVQNWAKGLMGGVGDGSGPSNGVYAIIPADRREILLQKAQSRVLKNQVAQDSADSANQFRVQKLVGDDIASVGSTGEGVASINPDEVRNTLGPDKFQKWQDDRAFAHATWAATHDMPGMTDAQIDERLASISPKAGQEGYAQAQQIFTAASKTADDIRANRRADPAGSVSQDPEVIKAQEAFSKVPADPALQSDLIEKRLAAQTRAGIPEDAQSPITKDEALEMVEPLSRMLPGQERETLKALSASFKQKYGEYAEAAMTYALRQQKLDKDTARMATRMIGKLGAGAAPDQQDARGADQSMELAAAEKAVTGTSPEAAPAPNDSMGSTYDPSQGREAALPVPPSRAVQMLRANPKLAPDFDAKYGQGQAEKILKTYSIRPKQPAEVAEQN